MPERRSPIVPVERLRALPYWQWLALLVLGGFFYKLGTPPLFDLDEGAFSAATWEMLERGDFITTYLNGEPRFDKPILIYWLQALSVSALGLNEWALRLPSALAAAAWMWAIFRFTAAVLDRTAAAWACTLATTALAVCVIGRAATADALLNLFIAASLFEIYAYLQRPARGTLARVFVWLALGFLTKGPIALAVPLVVSFLYCAVQRDLRDWLRAAVYPPGLALFFAIAAPWYVLEYLDQGQAFIDGFLFEHNVGRFADTMEGHGGTVFYYLLLLPLVVSPYAGWLVSSLYHGARFALADPLNRFLLIWFGFVFVFFSLSGTQLPHYALYGVSPLFVLMARYREHLRSRWLAFVPPLLLAALVPALEPLFGLAQTEARDAYTAALAAHAGDVLGTGYALGAGAFALAVPALAWGLRRRPAAALAWIGVAQLAFVAHTLVPAIGAIQQQPVREAAALARGLEAPVVMWRTNMPSFTVYRGAVTPQRAPAPGEVVFTRSDRLSRLGPHELLYSRGGIVLARRLPDGDG